MDSSTQENVSLVEETSTASASLQEEATRLADLVATFKLNHTTQTQTPALVTPTTIRSRLQPASSHQADKPQSITDTSEWQEF